jgi:hypothetical protein
MWTGIPISIGIAPTKTLAKLANRVAKKQSQCQGVFIYPQSELEQQQVLKAIVVEDIWGIGRQYSSWLHSQAIYQCIFPQKHARMDDSEENGHHWCQINQGTQQYILFASGTCPQTQTSYLCISLLSSSSKIIGAVERSRCHSCYHRSSQAKKTKTMHDGNHCVHLDQSV